MSPAFAEPHPPSDDLLALRTGAEGCERCELYKNATQVVFGEGPMDAKVVLVGEQPGDREDTTGRPFVGPAGRLLDECLLEAGIERSLCYVTNAVKHFKFERSGKRRLHARPNAGEIKRCAWWLGGEIEVLQPSLVVALGATALYALTGRASGLTKERGHVHPLTNGIKILVTVHPSFLLRIRDDMVRQAERQHFIADLRMIRKHLRGNE
jgi:DNA polymerase